MEITMNMINQLQQVTPASPTLKTLCLASCRKLLTQLKKTRDAILNEFRETFAADEHLLHLALNEAEALAWQSGVPHLVFPTLAMEKAQTVAAWQTRQRSLHRSRLAAVPFAA